MSMKPGELINGDDAEPYPYRHTLTNDAACTLLLVAPPTDDNNAHTYAIVSRQVSGWRCLAVGGVIAEDFATVIEVITQSFGPGRDYLPREQFAVTRPSSLDVHLRRVVGEPTTYCNVAASNPYEYVQGRYYQHCMKCTTTYLAENFGRHPFEEH